MERACYNHNRTKNCKNYKLVILCTRQYVKEVVMKTYLALCIAVISGLSVAYAIASEKQSIIEPKQLQKTINDVNRMDPLQNPRYVSSAKIMKRHILDNSSGVVGEVNDIIIDNNGNVSSLFVDFDRLRMKEPTYMAYKDLDTEGVTSGYRLGIDKDQIPSILSSIETAAGEDEKRYSVNELIGSSIITSDGDTIGKLEDILFDQEGSYVRSLYFKINYRTVRNKGIAVPLSVVNFDQDNGQMRILIDQKFADLIIKYAKES